MKTNYQNRFVINLRKKLQTFNLSSWLDGCFVVVWVFLLRIHMIKYKQHTASHTYPIPYSIAYKYANLHTCKIFYLFLFIIIILFLFITLLQDINNLYWPSILRISFCFFLPISFLFLRQLHIEGVSGTASEQMIASIFMFLLVFVFLVPV